jgi:hypothetical protein
MHVGCRRVVERATVESIGDKFYLDVRPAALQQTCDEPASTTLPLQHGRSGSRKGVRVSLGMDDHSRARHGEYHLSEHSRPVLRSLARPTTSLHILRLPCDAREDLLPLDTCASSHGHREQSAEHHGATRLILACTHR